MGNNSTLGERLAQLRKEHGYSQKGLSELLEGFNRDHVVKLENNKVTNPRRELIAQLVQILHTSYEYLETGLGEKDTRTGGTSLINEPNQAHRQPENTYVLKLLDLYLKNPAEETKALLESEVVKLLKELSDSKNEVQKYRAQIIAVLDKIKRS